MSSLDNTVIGAEITRAVSEVIEETFRAVEEHGGFASAHEALGVIEEEFIEFRDEVFKKRSERDKARMRAEAKQLAAMAIKAMVSLT